MQSGRVMHARQRSCITCIVVHAPFCAAGPAQLLRRGGAAGMRPFHGGRAGYPARPGFSGAQQQGPQQPYTASGHPGAPAYASWEQYGQHNVQWGLQASIYICAQWVLPNQSRWSCTLLTCRSYGRNCFEIRGNIPYPRAVAPDRFSDRMCVVW